MIILAGVFALLGFLAIPLTPQHRISRCRCCWKKPLAAWSIAVILLFLSGCGPPKAQPLSPEALDELEVRASEVAATLDATLGETLAQVKELRAEGEMTDGELAIAKEVLLRANEIHVALLQSLRSLQEARTVFSELQTVGAKNEMEAAKAEVSRNVVKAETAVAELAGVTE